MHLFLGVLPFVRMVSKVNDMHKALDSLNDDLSEMHTQGILDGWDELLNQTSERTQDMQTFLFT